jgi:ParB-like chromosome segregation protein Spo0J
MSEEEKDFQGVPKFYPLEKVSESTWNCNKMEAPEYEALKADMKARGPYGIDPIITARRNELEKDKISGGIVITDDVMVCVDGNHRLRAAKELKWKEIRVVIAEDVKDEETARSVSYAKNRERGHIDEWKEAENFRWLKEQRGWNQERIAKEYRIDNSQVSKRLSLLGVTPEAKEDLQKLPRVKFTASHFEPIATLKPELQVAAAKEIKELVKQGMLTEEESLTVKRVEAIAKEVKKDDAAKRELEAQVAKYEHKKCPKCKKDPSEKDYRGFPWVRCENYHSWNLKNGKTEEELVRELQDKLPKVEREEKPKAEFPQYLRTSHTLEEFSEVFSRFAISMLSRLESIKKLDLEGIDEAGEKLEIRLDLMSRDNVHLSLGPIYSASSKSINVERKSYETEALKDFKTVVTTWPEIRSMKKARETEQTISDLFEKFGDRPKRKRGKKKAKRALNEA